MKRVLLILAAAIVLSAFGISAQAQNQYRSRASGNWSAFATWDISIDGGVIFLPAVTTPGTLATDTVLVRNTHTVTEDTSTTIAQLTVGEGASGILRFDNSGIGKTLTVSGNVTIAANGRLDVATGGSATTHTLAIAGNFSVGNSARFDGKPAVSRLLNVAFNSQSASDQTISSPGTPTDVNFNRITLDRGAAARKVVCSIGVSVSGGANSFTWTNGTWEQNAFNLSMGGAGANQDITANGAIRITGSASLTVTGSVPSGSAGISGTLFINTSGNVSIGTGGDSLAVDAGGTLQIQSGTITVFGQLRALGGSLSISGGQVNIDPQDAGGNLAAARHTFEMAGSANVSFTGGTVTIVDPNATTNASNNSLQVVSGGTKNFAGSTIAFGDGSSSTSGSVDQFELNAGSGVTLGHIVVNNPSGLNRNVRLVTNTANIGGNLTITAGTLDANTQDINIGGNWSNNGAFIAATRTVTFNGSSAQLIGGSSATTFDRLNINNTGSGVSLDTTSDLGGSVTTALTLTSDLTVVYPDFLDETNVTVALSSGSGDVIGDVKRSDVGTAAVPFGNAFTQLANGSTITVDVILVRGTAPVGFPSAVKRTYTLMTSGSVSSATVQLHYQDGAELQSNTESSLNLYRFTASSWVDQGFGGSDTRDPGNNFVKKTGVSAFSSWTLANGSQGPLAVRLTRFIAASFADGVQLTWESGFEVNNLGYHLYRERDGKRARVTPSVVAGSALTVGPGSRLTAGYSYSWFDPQGTPDSVYRLEAIDLNGSRQWAGPIYPYAGLRNVHSPRRQQTKLLNELVSASNSDSSASASQPNVSEWPAAMKMDAGIENFSAQLGVSLSNNAARDGGAYQSGVKTPRSNQTSAKQPYFVTQPQSKGTNVAPRQTKTKVDSELQSQLESLELQQAIAAGRALKIEVRHSGWYRVTQSELAAAGFDSANDDARMLHMYVDGQEVPISLSSEDSRLSANDTLEFYGVGQDTPTTDARVYWLAYGSTAGRRMVARRGKVKPADPTMETTLRSFDLTTERRERMLYFSNLLNGDAENLFGAPVLDQPVDQILTVRNIDRESVSEPQLEVALQGLTAGSHQVQLQINGASVGTMTSAGREHPVAKFPVDPALLVEGDNVVSFVSSNGSSDISLIDWVRLTYSHQYRAENNALRFSAPGGQPVRIYGFSSPNVRVVDVTDPNSPVQLSAHAAAAGGSYSVRVQPGGYDTRILIAFTDDLSGHPASITANRPSGLNAAANGADMIIITHKDFLQAIEPLANLRRSQGLSVAVVDVEDVYDEFSFGAHTPAAIKSFLMSAAVNWSRKPQYLLLVGDSSWDPRNYLGEGENDFVPTKLIDTQYMETGSDDWLADFNGAGQANMAVGRLPGRTAADINLMVAKILSYEQERELNAPLREAVMVADTGFETQSSQTAGLMPAGVTVETINRADVGNDDLMRGQVFDALNHGPMIVNYYGHGSVKVWTSAGLLDSNLAATLTNANRLSVYVMMTCLNGYSNDAYVDSLGESVLKSPNGGAVAVWASSGFTEPQPQFDMNSEFYRLLFGPQPMRLGEAARSAKAFTGDLDVRRTWTLLGDPAMRIR